MFVTDTNSDSAVEVDAANGSLTTLTLDEWHSFEIVCERTSGSEISISYTFDGEGYGPITRSPKDFGDDLARGTVTVEAGTDALWAPSVDDDDLVYSPGPNKAVKDSLSGDLEDSQIDVIIKSEPSGEPIVLE